MCPTVVGYAAKAPGQPLERIAYEPPPLGANDIRVDVSHCGLCYTDVHGIDDYFGICTFPFVPGHEIVGRVAELGDAVTGHAVGDRVGIGWQGRSCGSCGWCAAGEEQLCVDVDKAGTWTPYGGFATSVTVDGRFAYALPARMPAETAAVLMCAGIAVYAPLRRYAAGGKSEVAVLGIGGLGHLAVQFAHAMGCRVTAISSSPSKEAEAHDLGADDFVTTDRASLRRLQDRFDLILSCVHGAADWESLILTLRRKGRLVLAGFPKMSFDAMEVVVRQLSITGSLLGSLSEMMEMLTFAERHAIAPVIELMPMAGVNEAIARLKANEVRYRVVLVGGGADRRGVEQPA
jgi:alcohol/geraniol dehydrogenase (NADP+)